MSSLQRLAYYKVDERLSEKVIAGGDLSIVHEALSRPLLLPPLRNAGRDFRHIVYDLLIALMVRLAH